MLTPARLREYTGPSGALDLLRDLGYPVAPVDVDPAEWRRGGVTIPWNGEARLHAGRPPAPLRSLPAHRKRARRSDR